MRQHSTSALTQMAVAIAAAGLVRETEELVRERAAPQRRAKGSAPIDFHTVLPHHHDIDGRLRNWGIWCNSTKAASTAPMFRLAVATISTRREQQAQPNGIDRSDAVVIARAVTALPERHAGAINWCYVKPVSPRRAAESIGVSIEGLAQLLHDGRQMLINRLYV